MNRTHAVENPNSLSNAMQATDIAASTAESGRRSLMRFSCEGQKSITTSGRTSGVRPASVPATSAAIRRPRAQARLLGMPAW